MFDRAASGRGQPDPRDAQTFYMTVRPSRRIITWLARLVFPLVADVRCQGIENLPASGPVVLVANHVSNYDVIPMQLCLPRPFFPMGKAELFELPVIGWLYRDMGAFPVRRGERDLWALKHAARILAAGQVLMMFPEGTRNRGQGLKPGKTGAARLAIQTGAPIVPLAVYGTHRMFKPWYRRNRLSVSVGAPITPGRFDGPAALTDRAMYALASLLPPDQRGVYREPAAPPAH